MNGAGIRGEAGATADIPVGVMAVPSGIAEPVAFALRPSLNGATLDVNGGSYTR